MENLFCRMPDFSTRSQEAEWMDGELTVPVLLQNLQEIHRLNLRMGIYSRWANLLQRKLDFTGPLRIAELGCGSGLGLVELQSRIPNAQVSWLGIDRNPDLMKEAKTLKTTGVEWLEGDAIAVCKELKAPLDWAIGTLFLHHLNAEELPRFLAELKPIVRQGLIFEDLERSPFSFYGFKLLSSMLGLSSVSKHDGAISVLRSFRKRELESVFLQAGWGNLTFYSSFPGRYFICATHV